MEIVKAKSSDVVEIMYLININFKNSFLLSLLKWLKDIGKIEEFVNESCAYIFKDKNITKAAFIISNKVPEEYDGLEIPNNTLFINLLLVHPDYTNQEVYNYIFSFIENHAKNNNFKTVILDSLSTDDNLNSFLRNFNYNNMGTFYMSLQKTPFYYFKKELN